MLIAVEPSKLKMWEGEWVFWGAAGMHVISYTGSAAARAAIHDYEMFLAPGCLDGKAPKRIKDDIAAKVRNILCLHMFTMFQIRMQMLAVKTLLLLQLCRATYVFSGTLD